MNWNDLCLMLLAKGYDSEVADCICRMLMERFDACFWEAEAPRAARIVIECVPDKEEDTCRI